MQFSRSNTPPIIDVVNTLKNPLLLSSIRAMRYGANNKNKDNFLRAFTKATLITLTTSAPITPDDLPPEVTDDGFNLYGVDTRVSLVQIRTEGEALYLPVFTDIQAVHKISGLSHYHGLALDTKSILEMALTAESTGLVLNPGTEENVIIDREMIEELVSDLRKKALLPEERSLNFLSHSFLS